DAHVVVQVPVVVRGVELLGEAGGLPDEARYPTGHEAGVPVAVDVVVPPDVVVAARVDDPVADRNPDHRAEHTVFVAALLVWFLAGAVLVVPVVIGVVVGDDVPLELRVVLRHAGVVRERAVGGDAGGVLGEHAVVHPYRVTRGAGVSQHVVVPVA